MPSEVGGALLAPVNPALVDGYNQIQRQGRRRQGRAGHRQLPAAHWTGDDAERATRYRLVTDQLPYGLDCPFGGPYYANISLNS